MARSRSRSSLTADSFSFSSGIYGDRPTFVITSDRNRNGDSQITLYKIAPNDIINAKQTRLEQSDHQKTLTTHDIGTLPTDTPQEALDTPYDQTFDWSDWKLIHVATLTNDKREAVTPFIKRVLRENDRNPEPICKTSGEATEPLPEGSGVQLAVAFKALDRMRRRDKMDAIAHGVEQMSLGESFYWYSQMTSPNKPNGVVGIRKFLAGHLD